MRTTQGMGFLGFFFVKKIALVHGNTILTTEGTENTEKYKRALELRSWTSFMDGIDEAGSLRECHSERSVESALLSFMAGTAAGADPSPTRCASGFGMTRQRECPYAHRFQALEHPGVCEFASVSLRVLCG